jgi:hypothetical protein
MSSDHSADGKRLQPFAEMAVSLFEVEVAD